MSFKPNPPGSKYNPRNPFANPMFDTLLKSLGEQRGAIPIPHDLAERMAELFTLSFADNPGGTETLIHTPMSNNMVNALDRVAKACYIQRNAVIRGLLMIGLCLWDGAVEKSRADEARYHLERALELAEYIAPADRQFAREQLLRVGNKEPGQPGQQRPAEHDNPHGDPLK